MAIRIKKRINGVDKLFKVAGSGGQEEINRSFYTKHINNILSTSLSTFDLSTYIDGYVSGAEYDIYCRVYGAGGYNINLYSDKFTKNDTIMYITAGGDQTGNYLFVPASRYIYAKKSNSTYMQIEFLGYRRVK